MRRALLAGSFDPPTLGHVDVIARASRVCDELTIAVAKNHAKNEIFSIHERLEMLQKVTHSLPNIKIVSVEGLIVDYALQNQISFLVRGIRSFSDLDQELQYAAMNQQLAGIETVFIPGNPLYAHLSSSLIRELAYNQASLQQCVPAPLEAMILQRFANK